MSDDQMSQDQHFAMDLVSAGQRQETNERLAAIEKHLAAQQAGVVAKCPYCDGDLTKIGVEICKHCSKELDWFDGIVHKPGEDEKRIAMVLASQRNDQIKAAKRKLSELYENKKLEADIKKYQMQTFIPMMVFSGLFGFITAATKSVLFGLAAAGFFVWAFVLLFTTRDKLTKDKPNGWDKNIDEDIEGYENLIRELR